MDKIWVTRSSMPSYEEFIEKIRPLWETRRLTNMGTYHKELETQLKDYLGVPHLSLMVLSLIDISEPTRQAELAYAVVCV